MLPAVRLRTRPSLSKPPCRSPSHPSEPSEASSPFALALVRALRSLLAVRPRTRPSPPKPPRRSPPHPPEPLEASRLGTNGPRPALREPPGGRLRPHHQRPKPPAGFPTIDRARFASPSEHRPRSSATFRSPPHLRSRSAPTLPRPPAGAIPKRSDPSETLWPLVTDPARPFRGLSRPRHRSRAPLPKALASSSSIARAPSEASAHDVRSRRGTHLGHVQLHHLGVCHAHGAKPFPTPKLAPQCRPHTQSASFDTPGGAAYASPTR
jgi:hypothetical protein